MLQVTSYSFPPIQPHLGLARTPCEEAIKFICISQNFNDRRARAAHSDWQSLRICVSAALAAKVENFRGRLVGDLVLRGRTEALRAFEPLSIEQYESPATKSYLDAFAKLEAGDPGALAAFASHVGKETKDRLASFHLKRLLNGATGTRIVLE